MSQLFTATDVTATNGNKFIRVNTGDDVSLISPNSWIQIGNGRIQEVKTVNTSATPQTIELFDNWNGASGSGQSAISAPTAAEIKAAAEEIRQLRVTYEGIAGDVNVSAAANSIAKRDSNGRLKASAPVASDDVVTKAYFQSDAALNSAGIFHSGNSVNPLDYGLGVESGDFSSVPISGNLDLAPSGLSRTNTSTVNRASNGFSTVLTSGYSNTLCTQLSININGREAYFRGKPSSSGFSPWAELYHSGNTNLNEFSGNSAQDVVATGVMLTSTVARVYLPLMSNTLPSSLTTEGQFSVFSNNVLIESNVTLSLQGQSSSRVAVINITLSSSVGTGNHVELRTGDASSKIKVNF
ncbi:hypothetical protein [Haliea sp.]|uniref:hypothetical protein n=1 Tax=Haliea sp. TaxID=1932666 RepID=UPI0025C5ADFB|nr:hypothetical protein [Haliea sp.]|tara:strand:- start:31926 stop:32987 length:1062 start_codon:yes stop_codon:yes gene_type:complete